MYNLKLALVTVLILLVSTFSFAQGEIAITKVKITDNVTLYKTGETGVFTNMIAVSTTNGVVVFDAHLLPSVAKKIRTMIESDFGKKIVYLINTHGWYDHTNGNMIFRDIPIIGHDKAKTEMERWKDPARFATTTTRQLEGTIKAKESYKGIAKEMEEQILSLQKLSEDLKADFQHTPPTISFNDKMTLTVGKTTFQMIYNLPTYSESDIIINIPEENVLIIGDIFNKSRLPWFSPNTNFNAWKELFKNFIADNSKIKSFIGTHGYPMDINEVKEQFMFIDKLREEVANLKKAGKTLDEVKKEVKLSKFPYLSNVNPLFYGTPINMLDIAINVVYDQAK